MIISSLNSEGKLTGESVFCDYCILGIDKNPEKLAIFTDWKDISINFPNLVRAVPVRILERAEFYKKENLSSLPSEEINYLVNNNDLFSRQIHIIEKFYKAHPESTARLEGHMFASVDPFSFSQLPIYSDKKGKNIYKAFADMDLDKKFKKILVDTAGVVNRESVSWFGDNSGLFGENYETVRWSNNRSLR